jgi:hypothetical protein
MADSLFLNLWFSDFELDEMFKSALAVMRQFPFSSTLPGVSNIAVHPVSWIEATILEQRFRPGATPEEAVAIAAGLLHEDYAYVFEAHWDLWAPIGGREDWTLQPTMIKFIVRGEEFEERESESQGDVQVDFGIDAPFLHEEMQLSPEVEARVRANIQKLVEFTTQLEKNSGSRARLLWSESEETLVQKLVSRLQKVH